MIITPQGTLTRCIEHHEIFRDEMLHLIWLIMRGKMSPVIAVALTMGLRVKKKTIGETVTAATVMRRFATKANVPAEMSNHLVDIVDTDGDGTDTLNISTASMFVAVAADARIAKHGERGISSRSGSIDVLEALDVSIMLASRQMAESIEAVDIGFMFVPNHHPAMENVAPIRRELGVRTIFSILGLLTNPAGTPNILMGVFHPDLVSIQVRVMQRLGVKHAVAVYGKDGVDEVSLGATTLVGELKDGMVVRYEIHPEDFRLQMVSNRSLKTVDADESKTMLIEALENKPGTPCGIVSLSTGATLYATNIASSIGDDMKLAREAITSGATRAKLDELVHVTNQFKA